MVKKILWLVAAEGIMFGYMTLHGTAAGNRLFYVDIDIEQKEAANKFQILTLTEVIEQLHRVIHVSCVSDNIFGTSTKCPFGSQKMKRTSGWIAVTVPGEIQFK